MVEKIQKIIKDTQHFFSYIKTKCLENFTKYKAHLWRSFLWSKYHTLAWLFKNRWRIVWFLVVALIALNTLFTDYLFSFVSQYFPNGKSITDLKTVLNNIGNALIGAAFIAFSLIMFSMQINIERMPHGLFFKYGKDFSILAMFVATLISGIAVCLSSLTLHDERYLLLSLSLGFWGTTFTIILIIQAYERTLFLINPVKQLNILLQSIERDLKSWSYRSEKAKPLLNDGKSQLSQSDFKHDIKKTIYMALNPHGKQLAQNAIDHAFSFFHRYAKRGDYVVSAHALQVIGAINELYIQHKGQTFYYDHPWFENPFSSDELVTHSLENLRKGTIIALARKDEQQLIQILQTFTLLINIYLQIDYSNTQAPKSHAKLAASYLAEAVTSILPHDMTDVVMEGLRLMGQSASASFQIGKFTDTIPLIDKIGLITVAGIVNKKQYPIIMIGMQQFNKLTLGLLKSRSNDLSFASKTLKKNVSLICTTFLRVPVNSFELIHSTYLGPYYSFQQSHLRPMLGELANWVISQEKDNEQASTIIKNFVVWSDQIYAPERELLIAAIKAKTDFLFHIVDWIKSVSQILLLLSNAPACDPQSKKALQKNATWLISNFSWVPDNQESVSAIASHQLHEVLFEASMDGYSNQCIEYMEASRDCLLEWAFKGGKYNLGWGILEHSLYGIATIATLPNPIINSNNLTSNIKQKLATYNIPEEILKRTARNIREKASALRRMRQHPISPIESVMKQVNASELQILLEGIADAILNH